MILTLATLTFLNRLSCNERQQTYEELPYGAVRRQPWARPKVGHADSELQVLEQDGLRQSFIARSELELRTFFILVVRG